MRGVHRTSVVSRDHLVGPLEDERGGRVRNSSMSSIKYSRKKKIFFSEELYHRRKIVWLGGEWVFEGGRIDRMGGRRSAVCVAFLLDYFSLGRVTGFEFFNSRGERAGFWTFSGAFIERELIGVSFLEWDFLRYESLLLLPWNGAGL